MEIDLLRAGELKLVAGGVQSDYRILVSRAARRPAADLYPFSLRDPIPRFPLPLQQGDEELTIDLDWILDRVYEEAALALAIEYTQQPVPAVSDGDFAWIQSLIVEAPR